MDPIYQGHTQCFNTDGQCYAGEELKTRLDSNPTLKRAFSEGCKANNPANTEVRCCPLSLMNRPYVPTIGRLPVHVRKVGDKFRMCPETIQSQCVRETDPENFILCVAEKCNDAGYLEAENYYQICKSFKTKGEQETIPDCPNVKCPKMMQIPAWYAQQIAQGKTPSPPPPPPPPPPPSPDEPTPLTIPTQKIDIDTPVKPPSGLTLRGLFGKLPRETSFYTWGSLILGILAIIVIVAVWYMMPRTSR